MRRSVSPFGTEVLDDEAVFPHLEAVFKKVFPGEVGKTPSKLKLLEDARFLPQLLNKIYLAPSNDAPQIGLVSQFINSNRNLLKDKEVFEELYQAMLKIFDQKISLFMIDHFNKEQCEKMEWATEYKDVVLFSKERDQLIAEFFAPVTEHEPGRFAEFISRWNQKPELDAQLHFLDFCKGAKNPTFEYYLLFAHPSLARVVKNKALFQQLLENTKPIWSKFPTDTWIRDVQMAFDKGDSL
ncbi:MAG: hypothetical protein ACKVQC_04480 [Elusimicrobiota bacterium]